MSTIIMYMIINIAILKLVKKKLELIPDSSGGVVCLTMLW